MKYKTESEAEIIEAYWHYKNGFLPNAGGWIDQPAKFSQLMILTDKLFAKFQEGAKKNG